MRFSGVLANICPGAHWAQRVHLQGVLFCQDEPRCGEDRHDSATALPVDRRPTGIRGGGAVPRFRGEPKDLLKMLSIRTWKLQVYPIRAPTVDPAERSRSCFFSVGGEGVLGSLPAPANPQPEAACSRPKGDIWGQFKNGDWFVEPDGQRDVGWPQHGWPTQGKAVTEGCVCHCEGIWGYTACVGEKRDIKEWYHVVTYHAPSLLIHCLYPSIRDCVFVCACQSVWTSVTFVGVVEIPWGVHEHKYTHLNKNRCFPLWNLMM